MFKEEPNTQGRKSRRRKVQEKYLGFRSWQTLRLHDKDFGCHFKCNGKPLGGKVFGRRITIIFIMKF